MLSEMVDESAMAAALERLIGHPAVKIDSLQEFLWRIVEQRTAQEPSGSLWST